MQVIKADGTIEPFSEEKLLTSIQRAGIPSSLQTRILQEINNKLYNNIPTSEIYQLILRSLDRSDEPLTRARYSLKQAIMQLGPTGYPFEDFIAKVLQSQGFETQVRQILFGKCVNHEIDVIATKDGKRHMVEAKYHNNSGTRSEVHVPLYVHSRFEDLKEKHHLDEAWVVTNTKATSDAIAYGLCVGMKIISWSFPEQNSLRDMVEKSKLHPITMLTTLSQGQKEELLNRHVVLCKELIVNPDILHLLHIPEKQRNRIMQEVQYIHNN